MKWRYFLSPLFFQKFIWVPTRILLRFCGHLKIHGLENLSNIKTNVIFACNHTSEFDVFMVPGSLPFFSRFSPIFYTSLENKYYKNAGWRKPFYGGNFFKVWGAYPVGLGLHNYEQSLFRQIKIIKDGGNMCFFPEGKITKDGEIQEAKGGVTFLAYNTGVPIVPVHLGGAFKISPSSFLRREAKLTVTFGKPIYITEKPGKPISLPEFKRQANSVMAKVRYVGMK